MKESEVLNTELADTLGYLVDKFNLTLEVSSEQLKNFSIQMAEKIINWELITSILNIIGLILFIIILLFLNKRFRVGKIKQMWAEYNQSNNRESDVIPFKIIFKLTSYFITCVMILVIINEIRDIILCTVFPEKIILEFISSYL